jgi:hypothetical protein
MDPIIVTLPDGREIEFPAGTHPDVMSRVSRETHERGLDASPLDRAMPGVPGAARTPSGVPAAMETLSLIHI